jgi:hypothetical protein
VVLAGGPISVRNSNFIANGGAGIVAVGLDDVTLKNVNAIGNGGPGAVAFSLAGQVRIKGGTYLGNGWIFGPDLVVGSAGPNAFPGGSNILICHANFGSYYVLAGNEFVCP